MCHSTMKYCSKVLALTQGFRLTSHSLQVVSNICDHFNVRVRVINIYGSRKNPKHVLMDNNDAFFLCVYRLGKCKWDVS